MKDLKRLLDQNREWAEAIKASDPEFFQKLAKQQSPKFLWIGCADSRVPANQLVVWSRARCLYTGTWRTSSFTLISIVCR